MAGRRFRQRPGSLLGKKPGPPWNGCTSCRSSAMFGATDTSTASNWSRTRRPRRPSTRRTPSGCCANFLSPALFRSDLYCRADDRGDPVVQLAPPLIAGPEQFDEMEQILRVVFTEAWSRLQPYRGTTAAAVSDWGGLRGGGRDARWTTSRALSRGYPPGAEGLPGGLPRGPPRRERPGRRSWAAAARTPPRAGRLPSLGARSDCAHAAHRGRTCAARQKQPAAPPRRSTRCRHRSMWRLLAGDSRFGYSAVMTSPRQGISITGFGAPVRDPTRPSW